MRDGALGRRLQDKTVQFGHLPGGTQLLRKHSTREGVVLVGEGGREDEGGPLLERSNRRYDQKRRTEAQCQRVT
jgi:hypothetical protein